MIILFAKSPVKGIVKKRLAETLGDEKTQALYIAFIKDTVQNFRKSGIPFTVFYYPEEAGSPMSAVLDDDITITAQQGRDLGERMKNACKWAFDQKIDKVLLVGSDIPDLPGHFFNDGFNSLDDHDAVIGPSMDGGYYLIGFRKQGFLEDIFHNIEWSTDSVYSSTINIFNRSGRSVFILPEWNDIDDMDDLKALRKKYKNTGNRPLYTLKEYEKIILT